MPGKNITPLAGKPLILWTLEAFANANSVDKVIFSTDSEEYWDIACNHLGEDKLVLDFRTPDEAGDKVKIFDYLKDMHEKIFSSDDETFVLGLPTAPFRNANHVDEAISLYKTSQKPVFSATEYGFPISFAFHVENDGSWNALSDKSPMLTGNTRSQDHRAEYRPNGAIYVRAVKDLASPDLKTLYSDALPYLMDRKVSIDVDNEEDFSIAAAMVESDIFQ